MKALTTTISANALLTFLGGLATMLNLKGKMVGMRGFESIPSFSPSFEISNLQPTSKAKPTSDNVEKPVSANKLLTRLTLRANK